MAVQLNHTIVHSRDSRASARFAADILGLGEPGTFGRFAVLELSNGISLDYIDVDADAEIASQHYAFLITEAEFDEIFGRITERGLAHWADPGRTRPDEINRHDGGRGVYFTDPDGHFLEILTRPYGSGA